MTSYPAGTGWQHIITTNNFGKAQTPTSSGTASGNVVIGKSTEEERFATFDEEALRQRIATKSKTNARKPNQYTASTTRLLENVANDVDTLDIGTASSRNYRPVEDKIADLQNRLETAKGSNKKTIKMSLRKLKHVSKPINELLRRFTSS